MTFQKNHEGISATARFTKKFNCVVIALEKILRDLQMVLFITYACD